MQKEKVHVYNSESFHALKESIFINQFFFVNVFVVYLLADCKFNCHRDKRCLDHAPRNCLGDCMSDKGIFTSKNFVLNNSKVHEKNKQKW